MSITPKKKIIQIKNMLIKYYSFKISRSQDLEEQT